MVVITDGDSDDAINTRHAADLAHSSGIITFSLGVGGAIHENELKTIATDPACTHVYKATDYAEIKFMVEEIQKATCIGKYVRLPCQAVLFFKLVCQALYFVDCM